MGGAQGVQGVLTVGGVTGLGGGVVRMEGSSSSGLERDVGGLGSVWLRVWEGFWELWKFWESLLLR